MKVTGDYSTLFCSLSAICRAGSKVRHLEMGLLGHYFKVEISTLLAAQIALIILTKNLKV